MDVVRDPRPVPVTSKNLPRDANSAGFIMTLSLFGCAKPDGDVREVAAYGMPGDGPPHENRQALARAEFDAFQLLLFSQVDFGTVGHIFGSQYFAL